MPNTPAVSFNVTLEQARAFWHAKQGLDPPPAAGDLAAVLERTGWARTLGGVDVYLALRARAPQLSRGDLDETVRRGALRVVPAVRGCIYLVPEVDTGLVMALAADLSRPRTHRDLTKVGVSWDEVEGLASEVKKALQDGPLTINALRKALPAGAARSLGAPGKKVGLSSPLPVALRELEFRGDIDRTPIGGRLDTERYEWRRTGRKSSRKIPGDPAGRLAAVARRFFQFFAPATTKELSAWVGVPQRDAKAAVAQLPLVPVAIAGRRDPAWVLEEDEKALADTRPSSPCFSFLPFEDNLLTVHGGPGVLVDPAHHGFTLKPWGSSKPTTLGEARHVAHRALLLGERLVGFWEYDSDAGEIAVGTFVGLAKNQRRALDQDCRRLAAFVQDELGHARSFSLDTDDAVRRRAEELRQMK